MEGSIETSSLEDNLDMGLTFGNDNQKIEKMNQSFILLKKKLLRCSDLIEQHKSKLKECERLKEELADAKKEIERYKQQQLTNTAKLLKLNMQTTKLEETNKKLEQIVSEQEVKIAGDQMHVQQLICKVEDIEDRNSEKIMEIELQKSDFQMRIKELEKELQKVRKMQGNNVGKSPKKSKAVSSKKGAKNKAPSSPFKSTRRNLGLGIIDNEDVNSELSNDDLDIRDDIPEASSSSEVPLIEITKVEPVKKQTSEIGINVNLTVSPKKPRMVNKHVMTDEFYNIRDNPYPLFCDKCEKTLDPSPIDAICKAMRRPAVISEKPLSPPLENIQSRTRSPSPEQPESTTPIVVLDSLNRRIKTLEKLVKRKNKLKSNQQSCCSHPHPMNPYNYNNTFNQQSQFDMMTEFVGKMMRLPGFDRARHRGERNKRQKLMFSSKRKDDRNKKKKKKKRVVSDDWGVEENQSAPNSSNASNIEDPGLFEDHHSEPVNSSQNVSISESNMNSSLGQDENVPLSSTEDSPSRKRKRSEDMSKPPPVIPTARSRLLTHLKRLKKIEPKPKTFPPLQVLDGVRIPEPEPDVPIKKKRIAHAPKSSETPENVAQTDDIEPSSILIEKKCAPTVFKKRRITRSLTKSTDDESAGINEPLNDPKQEDIVEKTSSIILANNETQEVSSKEKPRIEESPAIISDDDAEKMTVGEAPASPAAEKVSQEPFPEVIKSVSIYDNVTIESNPDEQPLEQSASSDCIRELRNRQIHVSPIKSKPLQLNPDPKEPDEVIIKSPMPEIPESGPLPEKIEVLLDRHLANSKKKPGRKPKGHEMAKVLQNKAETLVKKELQKLVDSPEWDNSLHSSVLTALLEIKSVRTVAKATVEFMADKAGEEEKLDLTHTPPAPPMRKSQQRVVTLINDLDKQMPDLINFIFKAIEYTLFRININPPWETVQELARLFIVLARLKKDRQRVRIMCCDAIYCLQRKCSIVLHIIMTSWPEVVPMFIEEKDQHLANTIVHIIRMLPAESKYEPIKKLIKGLYKYPEDEPSDVISCKLMSLLSDNYDKCIETALLLVSKREGPQWTYKHVVQGGLMQMIVDGKYASAYHTLKLLGFLMRSFPVTDEGGHVKKIVEQLRALAESNVVRPDLQEGAISALLSLSRHRFEDIAMSVLNWKPSRPLPDLLHEQLDAFFSSRAQQWNQIKLKSRKYASNV